MRILYLVHQYFPHAVGGTEIYTRGLARRAIAAGHAASVVTYVESVSTRGEDFGPREACRDGIPVVEMHYNLAVAEDLAAYEHANPQIGKWLAEVLDRERPDVVHAMHVMKLSASALQACYERKIPVVVTLCDFWFLCPRNTLLKWNGRTCSGPRHRTYCLKCFRASHGVPVMRGAERLPAPLLSALCELGLRTGRRHPRRFWIPVHSLSQRRDRLLGALARADRVVALSRFQRDVFVSNGFPPHKLEVIDHGLELGGLGDAPPPPVRDVPVFAFVGALAEHKGAHVLLEALARIPSVPLECRIYGAGGRGSAYVEGVRRRAAADPRVRWMGTFAPSQQGAVLAEADVLVVPALWFENNPLIVKAALAVGLPVMASRIGCLPEWVSEGRNGWLVPPGHLGAWARTLARVARERPARVAPAPIKGMDENAAEMLRIYGELAG